MKKVMVIAGEIAFSLSASVSLSLFAECVFVCVCARATVNTGGEKHVSVDTRAKIEQKIKMSSKILCKKKQIRQSRNDKIKIAEVILT